MADEEIPKKELNERQEKFCRLYATDEEFFGNGVQSYLQVYDIDRNKTDWYHTARSAATQLLSNIAVCARISDLLQEGGLNDNFVDKQLQFLITQFDDKTNKLGAIKEYNKLKQRIVDKQDVTSGGKPFPILGYVQPNNSNQQDTSNGQQN